MKIAAALAVLLLLTACAEGEGDASTVAPNTVAASPTPTREVRPTPEEIPHDPRSDLRGAKVTRTATGLTVEAWWACGVNSCLRDQALVTVRPDGSATYERGSQRKWLTGVQPDRPTAPPGWARLLVNSVPSLKDGVQARVGGSDGATLFPFEKVARSTDDGVTWTTYDVPEIGGERAYVSGDAVLHDGRYLALLGNWSGDRRHHPGPQHHGLWVSDGDDWSSYHPMEPVFEPALIPAPGRVLTEWSSLGSLHVSPDGGGVIWATSWDDRLYTSIDGAKTFTETRAR